MGKVNIEQIKKLREETGAGVMECKTALEECQGDEEKAKIWLKERGLEKADKKAQREVKAGLVSAYTHTDGKVGVLVEVFCETDFVARNEEFKHFAHELTLQVAAMAPKDTAELLEQPWIRDEARKIGDLLKEKIAQFGENIVIGRIFRFKLGED